MRDLLRPKLVALCGSVFLLLFPYALKAQPQVQTRAVTVQYTNLTNGIWFGVVPFVAHPANVHLWSIGKPASLSIRELAEEGNTAYISDAAVAEYGKGFGDSAIGLPALPGQTRSINIVVSATYPAISGAFMLDQTNDGFAGVDSVDVLSLSHPITLYVYALDAGTSKNIETKNYLRFLGGYGRVPENGIVHRHPGFAAGSSIPPVWRFDPSKPVARITISPSP
jgi:Spondin_N